MKRTITVAAALLLACFSALADEGMWMVNTIDEALMKKMQERGLQMQAGAIYDADAPGASVCDAVVALDFGCTGSIISDNGLVITNHHCAYSDVYGLSNEEHNYLEDGFWAYREDQEVPIPNKSIFFLKKVIDVTEEAQKISREQGLAGKPMGMRKLSHILEKKYADESGLEASLSSMWSGEKYYMALYKVYKDIRLVAAPPVSIAAYGGDIDNWEWPQHKCDFAMYRIYAGRKGEPAEYSAKNVPLKSKAKLSICTDGYAEGDFTMVIGFPGRTSRYSPSSRVRYMDEVELPVSNMMHRKQMDIINGWMNANPSIRLKYSDKFFTLSNGQELHEGQVQCCKRFDVVDRKKAQEKELQEWIDADSMRAGKWGGLIDSIDRKYTAMCEVGKQVEFFRETIFRGARLAVFATRLNSFSNGKGKRNPEGVKSACRKDFEQMDLKVEGDLMKLAITSFYNNIDRKYWGAYQTEVFEKAGQDATAAFELMWKESWMSSPAGMDEFLAEGTQLETFSDDPIVKFLNDVKYTDFSQALDDIQGEVKVLDLGREYTHAMYRMRQDKGIPVYPDANSTMRITYGTVQGYSPKDAVRCHWQSLSKGILEKYNPADYNFTLKEDWRNAILAEQNLPVDFLSDNDITGGNSGSPVMNARGELIGLAFDGNKESLASDVYYTDGYNMCVNVDIRFVLWTLRNYAHLDRILKEIGQ